jgi:hypothetical protein
VEEEMILRGLITDHIDIYQLGYRDDVAASASTHAKGGNTDVGQYTDAQIDIWRLHGWTMQNRSPWFPGNEHAHGWPWGCAHLAPGAQYQVADWRRRRNGLANHGPVQGRWPVDDWRKARDKRRKIIMALKDDIAAEVVERLRREYPAIADAVLTRDGKIPNTVTGNAANKHVSLATAVAEIGRSAESLMRVPSPGGPQSTWTAAHILNWLGRVAGEANERSKTQDAKLDDLIAAVAALAPQETRS